MKTYADCFENSKFNIIEQNFDFEFLRRMASNRFENNIYEIEDLNSKLPRTCTIIYISYDSEFIQITHGQKLSKRNLQPFSILFRGVPAQNADSHLSIDNVTWLVTASGLMKAVYEVDSEFYNLDLHQCHQIWGTSLALQLNKENRMKRINRRGRFVETPIVPESYFDLLLERDMRLKEVRQLFEIGSHPTFVRCHEVLECFERRGYFIFVVMDKQPGRSARDCIGDRDSFHGFRENEKSKKYFYHLLSGLAYWHDRGKAHTDIRPENILYVEDEKERGHHYPIKLRNFGLSKQFLEGNHSLSDDLSDPLSYPIGTAEYSSYESREDENYSDIKADMFSFGVTMFHLMFGVRPFIEFYNAPNFYYQSRRTKSDRREFEDWVLTHFDPSLPSSDPSIHYGSIFAECTKMSVEVKNLIAKLMYPDPAVRLTAREAMRHPWFDGISKSDYVEVDVETEVKRVDIVNVGYQPIVWMEVKEEEVPSSYLQWFLSFFWASPGTNSSGDSTGTIPCHQDDDTATATTVSFTTSKACTKLISRVNLHSHDDWMRADKAPTELTCLFRTAEQHEHYLQAKKASDDDTTTATLTPILSNTSM